MAKADGVNLRMQGAIKYALEEVSKIRPPDPVTFVAEKLLEYDQRMDAVDNGAADAATVASIPLVQFKGITLNQNKVTKLAEDLARGEVPEYLEGTDATSLLDDLVKGLDDPLLAPAVLQQLTTLLQDPTTSEIISYILLNHTSKFDPQAISDVFLASANNGSSPQTRINLGLAITDLVVSGKIEYSLQLRMYAGDVALRGALFACFVFFDHEWFLQSAAELYTDDIETMLKMLTNTCERHMTTGEVLKLQEELSADDMMSPESREALEEYLSEIAERDMFVARGANVRWVASEES